MEIKTNKFIILHFCWAPIPANSKLYNALNEFSFGDFNFTPHQLAVSINSNYFTTIPERISLNVFLVCFKS
jgi:hypothetical protein